MSAFPTESWQHLLPCTSPGHLMVVLAPLRGRAWNSVSLIKSALRAWHHTHGHADTWDFVVSDPSFTQFWTGFKKEADHRSYAKKAVDFDTFKSLLSHTLSGAQTTASLRDAVWMSFCFFGVRRVSEGTSLHHNEVTDEGAYISLFVRSAKNDQSGKGSTAFTMPVPELGDLCPVHLTRAYISLRNKYGLPSDGHFFCVTKGPKMGQRIHDSALRQRIDRCLITFALSDNLSTHSLRKGGASWWKDRGLSDQFVQEQGNWASAECMQRVYLDSDLLHKKEAMLRIASSPTVVVDDDGWADVPFPSEPVPPVVPKSIAAPKGTKPRDFHAAKDALRKAAVKATRATLLAQSPLGSESNPRDPDDTLVFSQKAARNLKRATRPSAKPRSPQPVPPASPAAKASAPPRKRSAKLTSASVPTTGEEPPRRSPRFR